METFTYRIKRTPRASKTRIVVSAEKIEVVAPPHVSETRLHQFVEEQWQWIAAALQKIKAKTLPVQGLGPSCYANGASIPFRGEQFRLSLRRSSLKKIKVEFAGEFIAHIPLAKWETISSDEIREALIRWIKADLKTTVHQLVDKHGSRQQLYPRSVSIRSQKSRWGSCGIHNDIAINWLLALAPLEVLEYVVVHEICHIREKNHSARFWDLVGLHFPDYKRVRRWLKQNGRALMLGI